MTQYRFKTKPYKHQVRAIRRIIRDGHVGLLCEPGTGKTKAAIDCIGALHLLGRVTRVLIIAPLSVVGVWEEEFEKHAPFRYSLQIFDKDTEGQPPVAKRTVVTVVVVNYDIAWRRKARLLKFKPHMVIADESHRIKRPNARRSRYMRSWKRAPYRMILTGTPTPKSYVDVYSQWVFLNHKRFGTNFNQFKSRYIIYGGYMGKRIKGYTNVPELTQKIRKDAIVKRKDEIVDLPERTFQRVPVTLEPDAMAAYMKMEYELFLELTGGEVSDAKNIAVKLLRLQQITGGWLKSDEGNMHMISQAKMKAAQERLEDLWDDDERVVIFARFRPEVQALCDFAKRTRIPYHRLDGTVGRTDRDSARRQFQARSGPSLFVAQIQAGGLGITLHSSAEVIFFSVTYALDEYIQACDRVHRIGQTRPVRYQHLVVPNSIDTDIYASLQAKQDIMDTIMGNPKKFAATLKKRIEARQQ